MTTLADIAKEAGVSPAVVSRVVNKDGSLRISAGTRAKVERALVELDYAPNVAARSLRSARSGIVALVVHDIANPVYAEILRGAQHASAQAGIALVLSDASVSSGSAMRLAQLISGGGLDGVIIQGAGAEVDDILTRAARRDMPTVLLQARQGAEAHLVQLPDRRAVEIATRHLVDLGHREIGCLATVEGLEFTEARLAAWRHVVRADADMGRVVYSPPTLEDGETAARRLLEGYPAMTGMVCFNVMFAIGALRATAALGVNVPDDLSVVAIHDIALAGDLCTPLTTISMPLYEMGRKAVELVTGEADALSGESTIETEPVLVERQSTAPPRGD